LPWRCLKERIFFVVVVDTYFFRVTDLLRAFSSVLTIASGSSELSMCYSEISMCYSEISMCFSVLYNIINQSKNWSISKFLIVTSL
jgi:hypothetical protein